MKTVSIYLDTILSTTNTDIHLLLLTQKKEVLYANPERHIKLIFSSEKIDTTLFMLPKIKPKKYRLKIYYYNKEVLFLSNVITLH